MPGPSPWSSATVCPKRRRTDAARDLKWFQFGVWKTRFESRLFAEWCDRPRLEHAVRARLQGCSNVRLLAEHRAVGLLQRDRENRIAGIRIGVAGGQDADLEADLVVDASGGGSRLPRWLAGLGYPEVEEDRITVDIGYASRVYRRFDDLFRDWTVLAVYPTPPATRRAGVLYPLDSERFLVTLVGWVGDHPPCDDAGFLDFAASLPSGSARATATASRPAGGGATSA